MRVLLLSGDVHCGKSTLLKGWCKRAIAKGAIVEGILAWPDDAQGRRHFTSLPDFTDKRAQVSIDDNGEELCALQAAGTELVSVGPYTFFKTVFDWAKENIMAPVTEAAAAVAVGDKRTRYVVLDEIGPLEINRGKGLEPAITNLFAAASTVPQVAGDDFVVIAVVRGRCVEDFKKKYCANVTQITPFLESKDWAMYSEGVKVIFPYVKPN